MGGRRRGLPTLADAAEALSRDRPWVATFIRGATLGALVGAALAGPALLNRRRKGSPPVNQASGTEPNSRR